MTESTGEAICASNLPGLRPNLHNSACSQAYGLLGSQASTVEVGAIALLPSVQDSHRLNNRRPGHQ